MALKAGYKGIKKIGTGLKLTTEGTLSLSGSGPAGEIELNDLDDVNINEPANGNILVYDSTDEEWKNAAPASTELNDLDDVNITDPANGNILVYDSTDEEWKNVVPTSAADKVDITAIGTNETGDTASRAYAVGEHFYKNGKFCTCTQAIAQGAQFTLGTNYVEGTVAESIGNWKIIAESATTGTWRDKLSTLKTVLNNLPENQKVKCHIVRLNNDNTAWGIIFHVWNVAGAFFSFDDATNIYIRANIINLLNTTPVYYKYQISTSGVTFTDDSNTSDTRKFILIMEN